MQRIAMAGSILLGATLVLAGGCSSSSNNEGTNGGTGGSSSGGNKASGGSPGSGGTPSGSGGSGTGGASTGGSPGSGGAAGGTGGAPASGGSSGSGGAASGGSSGTGGSPTGDAPAAETGGGSGGPSFFVTSGPAGDGGNLGGLDGADAKCKALAMAVSPALGAKTWKAYLSTATVNAKDRIGTGPWRNVKGEIIANNVMQLHDQAMDGMLTATWPIGAGATAKILDEKGMPVSMAPQRHDILTGTNMAGTVDGTNTCSNWTSTMGTSTVGHSNRAGGTNRPPSWNMAHTAGCAAGQATGSVGSGGGQGSIYCFAID